MDHQVRMFGVAGHMAECEITQWMAHIHGRVFLQMDTAGTYQRYLALWQLLFEFGQRNVTIFPDHGARITAVDRVPKSGTELSARFTRVCSLRSRNRVFQS